MIKHTGFHETKDRKRFNPACPACGGIESLTLLADDRNFKKRQLDESLRLVGQLGRTCGIAVKRRE